MDINKSLYNGIRMPAIGMGTWPLQGKAMTNAVVAAARCGYRAFDTAHAYRNEASLGVALQEVYRTCGLTRSDLFITSKVGEDLDHGIPDGKLFNASYPGEKRDIKGIVSKQLDDTLKDLHTDHLDLLLIHWPHPDYFVEIWKAMEDEYHTGKLRAIGVSNCRERHIKKILEVASVSPMVNQFEIHPLNTKKELISFCQNIGIQVEAFSPLMVMDRKLGENLILKLISQKHNKSIPQVILRWDIQHNVIPIPKSANPGRLLENINIFDFELTEEDMIKIDSLNENYAGLIESLYCPGY
jgi:methylglyoxal/glyoxal reductase